MAASSRAGAGSGPAAPPTDEDVRRRWELVLPHRDQLLVIARRRGLDREDAEDVVATALLRTVEHPGLDESRVGAFLCTTTKRLAVDVHRDRTRQLATGVRDAARSVSPTPFEEVVCDEDEARWLARRLVDAPQREREVLASRLSGLTAAAASEQLGLSLKATENAYTRLRQRAHQLLAAAGAAVAVLAGAGRKVSRPAAFVPVAAAAVVGLAIVSPAQPGDDARPSPAAPVVLSPARAAVQPPVDAPVVEARPARVAGNAAPAPSPGPARQASPAPVRTVVVPPTTVVDPRVARVGGLSVEERAADESFLQSVQRCVAGLQEVVADPTSDPCA